VQLPQTHIISCRLPDPCSMPSSLAAMPLGQQHRHHGRDTQSILAYIVVSRTQVLHTQPNVIVPFRRKLLTLRGFLGFGGNGGYFWTVTLLPLNDAVVLTFLAPAWVAILSPLLLRERPGKFTWFAIPVRAPAPTSAARPQAKQALPCKYCPLLCFCDQAFVSAMRCGGSESSACRPSESSALQVCILGVCLIARPQLETDKHKAHLHLVGIIVGLFQAFFSGTLRL
jgi:EamA-like transporter family